MEERIWSLPGPRSLIADTLDELKRGRHVCIVLPAGMAHDPAVTDSLAAAIHDEASRLTTTRRVYGESNYASLLEVFARTVDPDDPPATVPQLLGHQFATGTIFITVTAEYSPEQHGEFPKFLQRLEQDSHNMPAEDRMSVVVICGRAALPMFRGGDSSDVSLATVWWWNRIARWDTAAHIRYIDRPRMSDRTLADIRDETIVEVARWNLSLAARLAQNWSGDPAELPAHLSDPPPGDPPAETRDRCGPRPTDTLLEMWDAGRIDGWHDTPSPAPSIPRLRRLVWAAQARIVLPWIEQRREVLQEHTIKKLGRKRFNEALQTVCIPPLTDAGLVEIGELYQVINVKLGRTEAALRSTAWRLRDARNKAAHLDPLTLGELAELVNTCRNLY